MYKLFSKLSIITLAGACLPLVGCVDDKYDLSDVDTTAEIKVTDLVIPVNLDAITLSNVFDLDEGSIIKEINGEYAVLVNGDFGSDDIKVNAVSLARPYIPPTTANITLINGTGGVEIPPVAIGEQTFTYEVNGFNTAFNYTTSSVDKSIRELTKLAVDWTIDVSLTVNNNGNLFKAIAFRNMSLKLPVGLHTPDFSNTNGVIELPDINMSAGVMTHKVSIRVDEVDLTKLSASEFSFGPDPSGENAGSLTIKGNLGVGGGYVVVTTNSNASSIPSQTSLTLTPVGTDITVRAIDAVIRYGISDFNVDPIVLNDLPDVLKQEETNIVMANPRLYLSINNPMAGYELDASSGLTLTAVREDNSRKDYSLDPGQLINIGYDAGIAGPYKFCLAPDPAAGLDYAGFENASKVGYKDLGNVLRGKGLPSSIEVSFDDPHVGPGKVNGFAVPQTLDKIDGKYSFYAPLDLAIGSKIVYDEVTDGWSDDTVDKITIELLKVSATVTNSLPFDIVLSGYPVDAQGDQCKDPKTGRPVSLGSINVKAGETVPFTLESDGVITHIDGVRYYATAEVSKAGVVLRPDATITLKEIKAKVTGHYIDEL